uniref:ATP synthase subunit a n=1 Tax=Colposcenia aliena TaxID=3101724 RepID=A0AAU8G7U2_9HEMI
MFDPMANFSFLSNWVSLFLMILILPNSFWTINSRLLVTLKMMINKLHQELKSTFTKNILYKGSTLIMISCFMFIMTSNITSNFPYTFCSSAHLSFSVSLSIPIWLSIILFQWITLSKTMMAHLVPNGTPVVLMPLMVMIEITSNIIRPMALAVRLSANLIAGHLLMALLGNTLNIKQVTWIMLVVIQMIFLTFELMVGMIQAYVFSVLMNLYSSEIN